MSWYLDTDIQAIADGLGDRAERFAGETILLCGGGGFLGRYLMGVFGHLNAKRLSKPCRLIILDNLITSGSGGSFRVDDKNFRFITHDITKPLTLDEPIHYVLQAAGIASPFYYRKYPLETLEVATVGTHRMLDMALAQKVQGFLFFSSSEIYGDPDPRYVPTPESYRGNISCMGPRACYDESKRLGETLCTVFQYRYGLPTTIVRPFNVYGPGMQETDYRVLPNFMSRVLSKKPLLVYGSGQQTRTFCYVTDAITGFLQVLLDGTPGNAYNIGNPVPEITMTELADALERVVGRKLQRELIDYPDAYPADEPQRRCPDIRKASVQLGFRPSVGLDDGLKRFYDWADKHYTRDA